MFLTLSTGSHKEIVFRSSLSEAFIEVKRVANVAVVCKRVDRTGIRQRNGK